MFFSTSSFAPSCPFFKYLSCLFSHSLIRSTHLYLIPFYFCIFPFLFFIIPLFPLLFTRRLLLFVYLCISCFLSSFFFLFFFFLSSSIVFLFFLYFPSPFSLLYSPYILLLIYLLLYFFPLIIIFSSSSFLSFIFFPFFQFTFLPPFLPHLLRSPHEHTLQTFPFRCLKAAIYVRYMADAVCLKAANQRSMSKIFLIVQLRSVAKLSNILLSSLSGLCVCVCV